MVKIKSLVSNKLSHYRTLHSFERYAEISSIKEFQEYCQWAKINNFKLYILGNGSNTFFSKKSINTLIVKNKLPKNIKLLSEYRLEVSSSTLVMDVLKYCQENNWDSFYYLASVPATIGGALAMNAGRGKHYGYTIYDFVESITFFDNGEIKTLLKDEIERSYRQTIFTGIQNKIILSAVFTFSPLQSKENLLMDRLKWSKNFQDYTAPNCGTVFKSACSPIMKILKGLSFGKASFSPKTGNWILNKSENSNSISRLIFIAKTLHFFTGRKIDLEIIKVD